MALLICFTAFFFSIHLSLAEPFISEFQAANSDGIRDEDGDRSDWIEIFNPESDTVELGGMSLTNDPQQPAKWVLPDITLAPNQSLLIWASGKNRNNPTAALHTNFRLGASGEYLALMDKDGVTPLSLFDPYPAQPDNRSYGVAKSMLTGHAITADTTCRWLVPAGEIPDWEQPGFDDGSWNTASAGIGYDQQAEGVDFNPSISSGGNIESAIYGNNTTCYARIPFTVTDTASVVSLRLRLKYDDGCAFYLNGTRVDVPAEDETGAPEMLRHDSAATERRADVDAMTAKEFDLSKNRSLLLEGSNVLAIQLLNSDKYSPDALLVAELDIGRPNTNSSTDTGFYAVPTPGFYNAVPPVAGFVAEPSFSRTRGFFTDPITVTLASATPDALIRYTLDGSMPTRTNGIPYTGPISISSTVALHALAFRRGWATSPVVSHTYIFPSQVISQTAPADLPATWGWAYDPGTELYQPAESVTADYQMDSGVTQSGKYGPLMMDALKNSLPVVSLSASSDAIFGVNGIYSNGRVDHTEIPVSIEYFDPAKGQAFYENAGLRIHGGNAASEHPKKPFRVYFRKQYGGTGELNYPLYPDSPVTKFDKLQLRPGGHDGWAVPSGSDENSLARHATYLRDRFLRQTELDMGRLSTRGSYVHLYLNGLYWGVYDLHEVPDSDFYADHAGGKKDEWDALEHSSEDEIPYHVVDGNGAALDAALDLCRPASAMESNATYEQIGQLLNIDDFIDYLIVQMWAGNNDWVGPVFRGTGSQNASRYSNKNWQAGIRSRSAVPGKFLWNVWDAEISMGSGVSAYVDEMRVLDYDHTRIGQPYSESGVFLVPGPPGVLYHALQMNRRFRTRFADRLQKHLFNGGVLTTANSIARITALQNQLNSPIVAESARWGDVNSGDPDTVTFLRDEQWLDEVNWLKNSYITRRAGILLGQFHAIGIWPQLAAPVISPFGGNIQAGSGVALSAAAGSEIYYTTDGSDPMVDGAKSVTAIRYTGSLTLDHAAHLSARSFDGNEWSPLTEADFTTVGVTLPKIVVTEIYYNPTLRPGESAAGFTDQQFEFLELMNAGSQTVSLAGSHFTSGIKFTFTSVLDLAPGQRIILVSNGAAFAFRNPAIPFAGVFQEDSNLSNSGERLAMVDAMDRPLFDFTYHDISPWPVAADGGGSSMVLIDAATLPDYAVPQNWRASPAPGGTPGSSDTDSYTAWAARNSIRGRPSDTDSSGIPNLLNYALGPMPGTNSRYSAAVETLTVNSAAARYLVVRFRRNTLAEDVQIRPEYSTDLTHWSVMTDQAALPVNNADGTQSVAYRLPGPVSSSPIRSFVRIRGVRP